MEEKTSSQRRAALF